MQTDMQSILRVRFAPVISGVWPDNDRSTAAPHTNVATMSNSPVPKISIIELYRKTRKRIGNNPTTPTNQNHTRRPMFPETPATFFENHACNGCKFRAIGTFYIPQTVACNIDCLECVEFQTELPSGAGI